jgi:hypothetical protein
VWLSSRADAGVAFLLATQKNERGGGRAKHDEKNSARFSQVAVNVKGWLSNTVQHTHNTFALQKHIMAV